MTTKQHSKQPGNDVVADTVDGQELALTLGKTLRERRKSRGLTLQQLADQCGLSQPFLSQLENGKAMPSLLALHQVAAALGTSAQELLQPTSSADVSLVRGESTHCYELDTGTSVCFLVKGSDHQLETNLITAKPGAQSSCQLAHDGEEMIYVLKGTITAKLQDHDEVELHSGDAYTYPATTPHEWHNIGQREAQFLFITTPPSF